MLTLKEGLLTPNAGIDKSNIEHGKVVLYPRSPLESATALVDEMRFRRGVEIGVVVSDSRLMPTRKGTVGVALAAAGMEAHRGSPGEARPLRERPEGHESGDSGRPLLRRPGRHGRGQRVRPNRLGARVDCERWARVMGCRASQWTRSSASTCAALDTALGESSFEFQDFDLEVLRGQLRAALLALVSGRLQDVVGGPQIESRINRVAALGTDEFVGHAASDWAFALKRIAMSVHTTSRRSRLPGAPGPGLHARDLREAGRGEESRGGALRWVAGDVQGGGRSCVSARRREREEVRRLRGDGAPLWDIRHGEGQEGLSRA